MARKAAVAAAPVREIVKLETSVSGMNLNIVALCNDGSVWTYSSGSQAWVRLADIPQV